MAANGAASKVVEPLPSIGVNVTSLTTTVKPKAFLSSTTLSFGALKNPVSLAVIPIKKVHF
jgi:hypothetical protein